MSKKRLIIIFLIGIALFSACTTPAAVTPEVIVITQDPVQLTAVYEGLKAQALQTVLAEQTQQALNNPTSEPTQAVVVEEPTTAPTATPIPPAEQPTQAPAPTNTAVVISTAVTPTNPDYSCSLVSSSPAYSQSYSAGIDFDAYWEIKNTGKETWANSDIDFIYISGPKMHTGADSLDLSKSVASGETIEFVLDMYAPLDSGLHQEAWALQYGNLTFCVVTVTIQVD